MSLRTHSVVVNPDRWSGATAELARLLAPVTGVDVTPLTALLQRGPMTVEADMSPEDARRLLDRLRQLGIPAVIRPNSKLSEVSSSSEAIDEGLIAIPGTLEALEGARATDEVPRGRQQTMLGMKPMGKESSGWGQLFPDLESREASEASEIPPPLDALAGEDLAEPESPDEPSDEPHIPPALKPDNLRDTLPGAKRAQLEKQAAARSPIGTPAGGLGGAPPMEATPPLPRPPALRTADDGSAPPRPPRTREQRSENAQPPPAQTPSRPSSGGERAQPPARGPQRGKTPREPRAPSEFDGSKLAGLVPKIEDRPPYQPNGFDDRPEHHPPFAMALSIIAPGAGQVFNGDHEEGLDYGLKFWLIKPWIDSVRDARVKAEKIRTYWAPRPPEGTFTSVVKYIAAWWLSVVLVVVLVSWGGTKLYEIARRPPQSEGPTAQQIAGTFEDAKTGVLAARLSGLDAVRQAAADLEPVEKFSMPAEERAERLFALAFQECRNNNFSMCEAMMRRVAELKTGHRPALKLQTWASLRRRGGEDPMPAIEEVPSLTDIELQQLRQEMALEGEDVPPPPEPSLEDRETEFEDREEKRPDAVSDAPSDQ